MKPIIKITGFDRGMIPDITKQVGNGFNFCAGIDIFGEPGILRLSRKLSAMAETTVTNNITDPVRWMIKYSGNNKLYGLGEGRIYDYDNTVGVKWSLVHDDGNTGVGNGLHEFNGNLHWASNDKLGKFTGAAWTDSFQAFKTGAAGEWHPMVIYMGKLMIGDGRYIATLDSDDTWDDDALILPAGYRVRSLAVFGDRLVIGTWRGTTITSQSEATLFTWDGIVGHEEENSWTLKEKGIHAMAPWKNRLIVFAGSDGNIYSFDGAGLDKIAQIPQLKGHSILGYYTQVYPGAVAEYGGNLIFGVSPGTVSDLLDSRYGIYTLGQTRTGGPLSLAKSHITSGGEAVNNYIFSLLQTGDSAFIAGISPDELTNYNIDQIDITKTQATGPYIESQVYEIGRGYIKRLVRGIEVIAYPLQTNNTIILEYKLDNEASWQSLGTITSTNQGDVLKGINKRAKTIQVRLELVSGATDNYSPRIARINIY